MEVLKDSEKITQEEAVAKLLPGEDLVFSTCPCCKSTLAIYISNAKAAKVSPPILISTE